MIIKFMGSRSLSLMIALAALCLSVNAQTYQDQQRKVIGYNIISSALIGGIGSAIHKQPGETRARAFVRGFAKGSLSGVVILAGKECTYLTRSESRYDYILVSRLIHSLGSSMLENTAQNKKLFYNFGIDFGPLRYDTKGGLRLQPFATAGLIATACISKGIDVPRTLLTGVPYFKGNRNNAITIVNSVSVNHDYYKNTGSFRNKYRVIAHEIIHTMQYRESLAITGIMLKQRSKYVYWDVPVNGIHYLIGDLTNKEYYRNYYELEAEVISKGAFVP